MRRRPLCGVPLLRRWLLLSCLAVCCAASFSACAIQVGPPVVSSKNAINVPIEVDHLNGGGVDVLVDVIIDGQGPYLFVVDTGAESSLIDTGTATQLNLQQAGHQHQIEGIGGSQEATPVAIGNWSMGPVRLPTSRVDSASVQDLSGQGTVGLLGSDILSAFGLVSINYDSNTLTVYKQIA